MRPRAWATTLRNSAGSFRKDGEGFIAFAAEHPASYAGLVLGGRWGAPTFELYPPPGARTRPSDVLLTALLDE